MPQVFMKLTEPMHGLFGPFKLLEIKLLSRVIMEIISPDATIVGEAELTLIQHSFTLIHQLEILGLNGNPSILEMVNGHFKQILANSWQDATTV